MPDQQNPNNQNSGTIGISSFGSTPAAPASPSNNGPIQNFPEVKQSPPTPPQPAQAQPMPVSPVVVPPAPTMPAPAPIQSTPTPAPVAPATPTPITPAPMAAAPMSSGANAEINGELIQQSIIGGVDDPKDKPKSKFFHSHKEPKETPVAPPSPTADAPITPAPVAPSMPNSSGYNEITASGSKNHFALIAIIVGVVLLLAAGGGYYYLMVMNKPVEPDVQPVAEQPVEQAPVVEQSAIDIDPYIMEISQKEATASAERTNLQNQIKSLDFTNIDSGLDVDTSTPSTQPTTTEPSEPESNMQMP
jgi:hypothetical protein